MHAAPTEVGRGYNQRELGALGGRLGHSYGMLGVRYIGNMLRAIIGNCTAVVWARLLARLIANFRGSAEDGLALRKGLEADLRLGDTSLCDGFRRANSCVDHNAD